jgi:hypothetical protein
MSNQTENEEISLVIAFKKPFSFEENEYSSVDLSKLEDWSGDDLVKASKKYRQISGEGSDPMGAIIPETDLEYDMFVASETSGLPLEFFKRLPAKEVTKIKSAIIAFFLG